MYECNDDGSPTTKSLLIAKRMAELTRWQEEQKRLLHERQHQQRLQLGLDKQEMFKMLGLLKKEDIQLLLGDVDIEELGADNMPEDYVSVNGPDEDDVEDDDDDDKENDEKCKENDEKCKENVNLKIDIQEEYEEDYTLTEPTTAPTTNTQRTSGYGSDPAASADYPNDIELNIPKHKYLKRGEGLKQRFKIDPDALRLTNLPRYKFANAHPQLKTQKPKKRGILKQQTQTKAKNDLQPIEDRRRQEDPPELDAQEQRFQQLLISSRGLCNSTPDLKGSYPTGSHPTSSTSASVSPKVRFFEHQKHQQSLETDGSTTSTTVSTMQGITWAKVLDTQQIKPVQVRLTTAHVEDEENISIFELLEQKAREGNIDMNSSCIRAFMARKKREISDGNDDSIPVPEHLMKTHLGPQVREVIGDDDDEDISEDENTGTAKGGHCSYTSPIRKFQNQVRVRFSSSTDTHQYTEDTTSESSTFVADDPIDNVVLIDEFKVALFQALDKRKADALAKAEAAEAEEKQKSSNAESDELSNLLQQKADLVKQRLSELEQEISTFKQNNTQLVRMKQEHEMEKANYAHEHGEAMERLHNEKIQFECYMHDERIKLEDEKRKFHEQMKMQKSNVHSKEKKEIAALKQEVAELQTQIKQKEQNHVAAQARIRAQMRNLEKEQRQLYEQIDELNKENKKLQMAAMKVDRENSNKMLQEINRNIARLAPKVTSVQEPVHSEPSRRTKSFGGTEVTCHHNKHTTKPARQSIYGVISNNRSRSQPPRKGKCTAAHDSTESDSDLADDSDENDNQILTELNTPDNSKQQQKKSSTASPNKSTEKQISSNSKSVPIPADKETNNATDKIASVEFKREIVNPDGSKDVWYPNGNLKKISADGMTVRMLYFNQDIKETDIRAGTVKYYYAETNTWHTTYLDGLEILEFPNGQIEHRHKNGVVEIHFPNNTIKIVDPSDEMKLEEWRYADGTHLVQMRNGDKVLSLPNGQKEIHTKLNKRREYPDGTVKLVYPDGSQETRYSNGRVRLKDKNGKLIMDTDMARY